MYYVPTILNHLKAVHKLVRGQRGGARVDVESLVLEVSLRGRTRQFQPQFTISREQRIEYRPWFGPDVSGFIGWRPYFPRSWPLSADKPSFKDYARSNGLRVPPGSAVAPPDERPFIIKGKQSSFGVGMRGPFPAGDAGAPHAALAPQQFYETYVAGRIAKAWYWNGCWAALELRPPPRLLGDGRQTWRQLAQGRCRIAPDWSALETMAHFQGVKLDDISAEGASLQADFKYGTPYDPGCTTNENVIDGHRDSLIGRQFADAGPICLAGIPESLRDGVVFTLDAIVDDQDAVWFLEMNANPMVHPDVYPVMLDSLFPPGRPS
ncbi:MAG: hypothetical protein HZA63_02240 [Rhodocyclales bacterium]|nr:hypothetical protein [Rhodocyclales bacterium]